MCTGVRGVGCVYRYEGVGCVYRYEGVGCVYRCEGGRVCVQV